MVNSQKNTSSGRMALPSVAGEEANSKGGKDVTYFLQLKTHW
jgi:hypothetical protein